MTTPLNLPVNGEAGTIWPEKFRTAISTVRDVADSALTAGANAASAVSSANATAATALANALLLPPKAVNSSAYTLALADPQTLLNATIAGAITITVPANSAVAFPVGTVILGLIGNASTVVTITGTPAIRRVSTVPLTFSGQWASFKLHKIATDEWHLDHNGI